MNSLGLLLPKAITPGMAETLTTLLRGDGWQVEAIRPNGHPLDPAALVPTHSLYLLLSSSPLAIAMAGALTARGAVILNPHAAVIRARDPAVRTAVLAATALPVPPTWITGQGSALAPLCAAGPLRVQPHPAAIGAAAAEVRDPAGATAYGDVHDRYGLPVPLLATRSGAATVTRFRLEVVDGAVQPAPVRCAAAAGGLAVAATAALDLFFAGVDFADAEGRLVVTGVDPVPRIDGGVALGAALAALVRRFTGRLARHRPAPAEAG